MPTTTNNGPVPSPCISVCAMDQVTGWCAGCLRTLDEIALWSVLDDHEKRDVLQQIDMRRYTLPVALPSPKTGTDADR